MDEVPVTKPRPFAHVLVVHTLQLFLSSAAENVLSVHVVQDASLGGFAKGVASTNPLLFGHDATHVSASAAQLACLPILKSELLVHAAEIAALLHGERAVVKSNLRIMF